MEHAKTMNFTTVTLFAQTSYGTDTYGGGVYTAPQTSSQPNTNTGTTAQTGTSQSTDSGNFLADTGLNIMAPILGGTFLVVTAGAILIMKLRRSKRQKL